MLDRSKFKAHADDKINAIQNLNFVLGRVENILGKGENTGYHHFLLFPKCFQKAPFSSVVQSWYCAVKRIHVNSLPHEKILTSPNGNHLQTTWREKRTSILKVLHGNTKSPTGCMYSWRYNIPLEVKEGI